MDKKHTVISILLATLFLAGFNNDRSAESARAAMDRYEPAALFLTWQADPATTMTIDWHITPEDGDRPAIIQYRLNGEELWNSRPAGIHKFPHSDRIIYRADLRGLEPGSTYQFRFGEDSKLYSFRTLPETLDSSLTFAAGGDTWHEEDFRRMNRVVMEYDPEFIVWGGDLAYAHGDPAFLYKWYGWFDGIRETLISPDGRVVPIILALGNHEVFSESQFRSGRRHGGAHTEEETVQYLERYNLWNGKVTFFFDLFAFPGNPAYGVLDAGDYLSLILLDSQHHSRVEGPQTGWLDAVLAERTGRPHLFPVYHVPAYPSHRPYEGTISRLVREHWVPLFERYGVLAAFENHDHTYKRTHPIRNGQIDENGVIYVGDGSWVAGPRDGDNRNEWYIDKFASQNHAILVTIDHESQHYTAVSIDGEVIDSFSLSLPEAVPVRQ